MQKVFNFFLEKTVISVLKDLYEYLFLKIPAKNSSYKLQGNLLSKAARLLRYSDGKNCCWSLFEIITVIALHHPVSAAGNSLQKPKNPRF